MPIHFFSESLSFELSNAEKTQTWLGHLINNYHKSLVELNYIFCSDDHLLKINQEYLGHDYYTDIITFDHSDSENEIEGDIFISIDRIKENAKTLSQAFDQELARALAHGLLHLFGFGDGTDSEKKRMRKKEDACLSLR